MPRCRLDNRTITAAQRAAERSELWDTTQDGLNVVVTPGGSATFYVRYRCAAGQRRFKLGRFGQVTIEQARKAARAALAEAARGIDLAGDRRGDRKAPTLATFAVRFMDDHAAAYCKPRTVEGYEALLRLHVVPALGRRKLASIGQVDVERMHQAIGETSTGAANRALHLLSTLLTKAEQWGERPRHSNPCSAVKRFAERPVERFLDAAERARLHAVLDAAERATNGHPGYFAPAVVACVRLLALTGARLGEITGLAWSMVDRQHRCLRLPDSKTGQKVIPLSRTAFELLERLHTDGTPASALVCPSEQGGPLQNMQRAWAKIRVRANLANCRLHDLRHSAASDALMAGLPLAMVGALLGHKTPRTTQRYAHLDPSVLRAAAERMGDAIDQRTRDGAEVIELRPVRDDAPAPKREAAPRGKRARSERAT